MWKRASPFWSALMFASAGLLGPALTVRSVETLTECSPRLQPPNTNTENNKSHSTHLTSPTSPNRFLFQKWFQGVLLSRIFVCTLRKPSQTTPQTPGVRLRIPRTTPARSTFSFASRQAPTFAISADVSAHSGRVEGFDHLAKRFYTKQQKCQPPLTC